MASERQALGAAGERLAVAELRRRGCEIVATNHRTRYGEIDVIARQGSTLRFVEVRTRRGDGFGTPEESVTANKRARLARLAEAYLQTLPEWAGDWQIDVVAIQLDARGRVRRLTVLENVVEGLS